jgi:hypothetical protein
MQSRATNVGEYLASLPDDRRRTVEAVRKTILDNLNPGYAEGMSYGMIGYAVPHGRYPAGYHADPKQPLPFAALASQKGHLSLYLMSVYCGCDATEPTEHGKWFREAWAKSGKKLDMGKSCIRFKRLEDLPLDVIGEAVRRVPVDMYIAWYEASLEQADAAKKARANGATKAGAKPAAKTAAKAGTKPAKVAAKPSAKPAKTAQFTKATKPERAAKAR